MRSYPRNSSQAAARIVALTMLADGHLSHDEFEALEKVQAARRLGMLPSELMAVLHDCCEDLQSHPQLAWADACRIDPATLSTLLDEVTDPALRREVLGLCSVLAKADHYVADAEEVLLGTLVAQWGLQHTMFTPPARPEARAASH